MSNKLSLTQQSIWILFAKITGFVLSVSLPLLTVRYLSQQDFGIYRQSFLVIANVGTILPLGFSMSAYYFLNRETEDRRASTIVNVVLFNFVMGALSFCVFYFFPGLLGSVFQNERMEHLSPLIGMAAWLLIFSSLLEIIPMANQEARLGSLLILFSQSTKALLLVASVMVFHSVEALLYAWIFNGFVQTVVLVVYLTSRFRGFWFSFDWDFFRRQMAYAIPFGLASLLYITQTDIHNYFVSNSYTAAEFAIYSIGCFQLPLIMILYESVSSVVIPQMSQMQAEGRKREMLLLTVSAMEKLALVYFPLFFFLEVVAEVFITTLFTRDYAASVPIFRINLLLLPFFAILVDPIGRAFKEIGRFLLKLRMTVLIALIVILWFAIGNVGLRGIITIVVATFILEVLLTVWRATKALDVKKDDASLLRNVGRIGICAAASGAGLLAFYLFFKDAFLRFCYESAGWLTSLVGLAQGSEFLGGVLFLGSCFALYAAVYIFLISRFGVITESQKLKIAGLWNRVTRRFA